MFKLFRSTASWNTEQFENVFQSEVCNLDHELLPLKDGLSQTSYVSDSPIKVSVFGTQEIGNIIRVRAGIFFNGIDAGSCCADDPTPVCEQPEYCVMQFDIHRLTADSTVVIVVDN